MAVNVNTVYQTVLFILNKEQRGYMTPAEFNSVAQQVQLEIFEKYFEDLNQYLRAPRLSTELADRVKVVEERISEFETTNPLQAGYILPDDLHRFGTMQYEPNGGRVIDLIEKIKDMIQVPDYQDFNIPVYVMEKDNINVTENCVKDGIHLIFGISLSHTCQLILRNNIIEEINDIFEDLPLTNSYDQLVDIGIAKGKTNWQLYGSKKPGHDAYQLKKIYHITLDNE